MPIPLDSFAGLLAALRAKGSVQSSKVRGSSLLRLRPLIDAGVLIESRAGSGKSLALLDVENFDKFVAMHYPTGLFVDDLDSDSLDKRTLSLTRYRDSKMLGGLDFEIVQFKLLGNTQLRIGSHEARASALPGGLGSFVLHDNRISEYPSPTFSGRLATVENPTVFLSLPWRTLGVDLVVLTHGRMSRRMISWLSSVDMQCATITHFGDYDPVGLSEFLRLHEHIGERAAFFIPPNVDELFKRFSKRELLTRSSRLLPRLEQSVHPEVRRLLSLMRSNSGGLEHESLIRDVLSNAPMSSTR